MSARRLAAWLSANVFALLFLCAAGAGAQVFQTDAAKTPLPQPVGSAELNLVNGSWAWSSDTDVNQDKMGNNLNPTVKYGTIYAPPMYPQFVTGDAITLQGLFKWRKETIDPVKDASTGPGYFSAKCGFSGQLLLMGGNCQVKFGWYNVTDPASTTPPDPSEIYPFIDEPLTSLNCTQEDGVTPKTDGFCPLAWDNVGPRQLSKTRWVPKTFSSGDISKDPHYKGAFVAFAVIGASTGMCTQSKFSMYEHNQRNAQGVPWVTTLIYHSTVDPGGFYMAFEDLPMPAAGWKTGGQNGSGADGDFNDFVFYVSGLTCDGGNMPCNTGQLGACSVGRTDCSVNGAAPACRPVVQKGPEVCDNVDNDCDGMIDNGDGLCPDADKPFCFQGQCVGKCLNGEFKCPTGLVCDDNGHCSDPACAAISCMPGTACRNGQCVDPCTGVTCPYGQSCQLGQCVDPCMGVTCPGDRVCERGLCVANCSCRGCDTGLTCGADGKCADPACATVKCATGTNCKAGVCVDACKDVVCPHNAVCTLGVCSLQSGDGSGGDGSGSISFGGGTGINFPGDVAGSSSTGTDGSTSSGHGVASKASGCGCRMSDRPLNLPTQLAWLGSAVAIAFAARKRREGRKSARNQ